MISAINHARMATSRSEAFDPARFVEARKAKKLSQRAIAGQVGISQPQLVELERGKRPPTEALAARLAEAVGVELSQLKRA